MTDLQQNKVAAKAMVQGFILEQVGKGIEVVEDEMMAGKFSRVPLAWFDEFIEELFESGLVLPTIVQNGDRFDAALRAA